MDKPNIVIIMTDQQRADLSAREGFSLDTTPFLDSLAWQGIWFDKAYTSMPVCAPARVSMLTGRWPSAHRVRTNHNIEDAYYDEDLFDVFRKQGYATALIGKNHSHLTPAKCDYWFECGHLGILEENLSEQEKAFNKWLEDTHFHMSLEPTPFPLECQIPYRLVSKAEEWIKSVGRRSFLLWLSFPEPHNPYQVPEPYWSMFPPESLPPLKTDASALEVKGFKYQWCRRCFELAFPGFEKHILRARANYMGMLRLLDDQIKRFVGFLEAQKLLENTIIVFLSDHGDFVGEYGLLRKGPELPEALVRIPMQFSGPGIQRKKEPHPAHVSIVDIMPTLCEAAGIPLPMGVQGRSLLPLLTGEDYPEAEFSSVYVEQGFGGFNYTGDESLDPAKDGLTVGCADRPGALGWGAFDCLNSWTQSGSMAMVRKGHWKFVIDRDGREQFYYLKEDPAEMFNISSILTAAPANCKSTLGGMSKETFSNCTGATEESLTEDLYNLDDLGLKKLTITASQRKNWQESMSALIEGNRELMQKLCLKERELMRELLVWRLHVQDPLPLPRRRYVMKRHPRGYRSDERNSLK